MIRSLTPYYLGLEPYAVLRLKDNLEADLQVGGTSSPDEILEVAYNLRRAGRELRKVARRMAREAKREAKAAKKDPS